MRVFGFVTALVVLGGAAAGHAAGLPEQGSATGRTGPVKVMVLGTYHFAGSHDVINAEADSVLTPKRQKELAKVAAALAGFKPTAVVTERVTEPPDYRDPYYARFNSGMLAKNENERVQLAYRLAAAAGVKRVYGLDETPAEGEPDYFPFDRLQAHVAATDQKARLDSLIAESRQLVTSEMEAVRSMTMAEALIRVNTGPLSNAEIYYRFLEFDTGEAQPAAELNAYWFMRNAKIFSKLLDVARPGDRIVMIFGAGHIHWLEHLVEQMPGVELIDPVPWLKKAAR